MLKLLCLIQVFLLYFPLVKKIPVVETGGKNTMPAQWIDKETGHKIVHLVNREGDNRSFYFHNNPFLPAANGFKEKMIFYGRVNENQQLFSVVLKTGETTQISDKRRISGEIAATKNRMVYYQCGDSVFELFVLEFEKGEPL